MPMFAFPEDSAWGQCLSHFLSAIYARSRSSATLTNYRGTLTRFFAGSANGGPPKLPDRYSRADIEDFLQRPSEATHNRGAPAAAGTINTRLAILKSFYRYAAMYQVEGTDGLPRPIMAADCRLPTAGMRAVQAGEHYKAVPFDAFTRFFAAIPTDTVLGLRDRALFLCYFWTARRRAEVLRLRWGDIEERQITDPDGSRRPGWIYRFRGKGHQHEDDFAELPAPAKRAIDAYLAASGRLPTMQAGEPLFVRASPSGRKSARQQAAGAGASALHPGSVLAAIKRYARAAGLDPKSISTHSFRHTAARERYLAGEDIRSIQHLLRHRNLATTDRYLRVLVEVADPGAKRLEAKFGGFS